MPSIEDYDDFPVNQKSGKGGSSKKNGKNGGNPNGKYSSKHVRLQMERAEKASEKRQKEPKLNGMENRK
jgi:hypothetical protein